MKLLKQLLRNRKGISMTEVVIAMAVVLIVSGAAISVLIASMQADAKFGNKSLALAGCENAVECIRFANTDASQLEKALETVDFVKTENPSDSEREYVLVCGEETVKVQYKDGKYIVFYNGDVIYERT